MLTGLVGEQNARTGCEAVDRTSLVLAQSSEAGGAASAERIGWSIVVAVAYSLKGGTFCKL
ncbi:MAG TPA: hypothetical protein VD863_23195, partial [Bradyrhizobium sp.]|nr:hypothetical protein [Bradyrhizobium sp.]